MNAPAHPVTPEGATPVMAQFFEAKARQPDALVFFRMGDFYELFFDDAAKAAAALGIALTHRGSHGGAPIPMCGVPVHAAEAYLAKLIRSGFKVAVCEQMESPAEAKKRGYKAIVHRDVVRVVTPGTLTEDGLLDARGANRLAAVAIRAGQAAVASVELSTGEVESLTVSKDGLAAALAALAPSEILVPDRLFADSEAAAALKSVGGLVQPMAQALAEPAASIARCTLSRQVTPIIASLPMARRASATVPSSWPICTPSQPSSAANRGSSLRITATSRAWQIGVMTSTAARIVASSAPFRRTCRAATSPASSA
jgi:DNA mismatch repair protein MutS